MDYNLNFKLDSSWNTGLTGSISLGNPNPTSINGWTIEFDAPFKITNLWNGQIVSHVGNHYVIRNASWNGTIGPSGTASFGFQASYTGSAPQPTGYIVNGQAIGGNPALPTLAVADVSLIEGSTGSRDALVTVSLSKASSEAITVNYATANGTAQAGADYVSKSGALTFAPGETSKTIAIPVIGDTAIEANESFVLNLSSPTKATIADGQGTVTITNDDATAPVAALSVSDVSIRRDRAARQMRSSQ